MKQSVLDQATDGVLCGSEVTSITDIIPGPSINETCPESIFLMNNLTKYPLIQTKQSQISDKRMPILVQSRCVKGEPGAFLMPTSWRKIQ